MQGRHVKRKQRASVQRAYNYLALQRCTSKATRRRQAARAIKPLEAKLIVQGHEWRQLLNIFKLFSLISPQSLHGFSWYKLY